ncbi:MAG: DUF4258 domain-containing protein [Candidatus Thermoplasmatota archaeon]|nr:DUF4258 domain-containing protein [Candidatus Thermoplasmatota archaeon]
MPVKFKKHASYMLMKRFGMYTKDVRHCFKVGTLVKRPEKEGDIGILQSGLKKWIIRFVFTVRDNTLWIITVEKVKKKKG